MEKRHLKYTDIARRIRNKKVRPSLSALSEIPEAQNKKEAYGISCIAMEMAKIFGDTIKDEDIEQAYNKIKGRNQNSSKKDISHIFQESAYAIPGSNEWTMQIRQEMERRSNKNMTKIVAETVLETILPKGSANTITHSNSGWQQLFVAVIVVLGIKLFGKR